MDVMAQSSLLLSLVWFVWSHGTMFTQTCEPPNNCTGSPPDEKANWYNQQYVDISFAKY